MFGESYHKMPLYRLINAGWLHQMIFSAGRNYMGATRLLVCAVFFLKFFMIWSIEIQDK